jgi:predicted SnoaL-like aldol condensation-catalyzing enzyme
MALNRRDAIKMAAAVPALMQLNIAHAENTSTPNKKAATAEEQVKSLEEKLASLKRLNATAEENKKIAIDLCTRLFNEKDTSVIDKYIVEDYIQHSPTAPSGRAGIHARVGELFAAYPKLHIDIRQVISEGNLVALHYIWRFKPEDRGMAIVDILRIEGGKVREHWDVVQEIPDPAKSANRNGMF